MRIWGDDRGLEEKLGEDGAFLLLEMTESMGRKDVELGEKDVELELELLPLVLPFDFCVVMWLLESRGD